MISEVTYFCKIDRSMQPAIFYRAKADEPRPLLVALHTWSYDHSGGYEEYAGVCKTNDWHMIFPKFRGPNNTPEACGSDFVVSDIEDAVAYMKKTVNVDPNRVYLVGGSGGGHCSLLLAGRRPDLWTAVSAWCAISDIAAWHRQCKTTRFVRYAEHIEQACSGDPQKSAAAARECLLRSPVSWLANAAGIPVDISTGIHDGHTGSVPVSHTFNAFNILAAEKDRIAAEDIDFVVQNELIPPALDKKYRQDSSFDGRKIHFRRQSANARITIFEGGHNLLPFAAAQWLAKQVKGKNADWSAGKPNRIKLDSELRK
ncbi:MAG: prolyl oligopeptidase [Lentisphaerae bacterium]|nr:prolyl oligopeptidase [Lentisphaerota bacterium]